MLPEVLKYWDLLYMLTFRDVRIRYKQAVMGFFWAIFGLIPLKMEFFCVKSAFFSVGEG